MLPHKETVDFYIGYVKMEAELLLRPDVGRKILEEAMPKFDPEEEDEFGTNSYFWEFFHFFMTENGGVRELEKMNKMFDELHQSLHEHEPIPRRIRYNRTM